MFEYLPLDQQSEVVETLGTGRWPRSLNGMAPDDRTRLFEELPAEVTKRALSTLSPEELKIARQLLGYPEGTRRPLHDARVPRGAAGDDRRARRSSTSAKHGPGQRDPNVVYVTDDKGVLLDDSAAARRSCSPTRQRRSRELDDRPLVSIPATATARRWCSRSRSTTASRSR